MIRMLFVLASTILLAVAQPLQAQAPAPVRLELNIPTLRLLVYEGDEVIRSYPVAVGMPGHGTPTGEFEISHAAWNPWWRPPAREWAKDDQDTPPGPNNPMGRVKLFFAPLYFIHGTPKAESIGTPASHGCVRMRNEDVIELARLLHEAGEAPVSQDGIDQILDGPLTTRRVGFNDPVPLTIRYMPVVIEGDELLVYPDLYGRRALHAESVYQALLAAGYNVRDVERGAVDELLNRASQQEGVYRVRVDDFYGRAVAVSQR